MRIRDWSKGLLRLWCPALVAGVVLCGCAVGPNYKRPEVKVDASFGELAKTTSTDPAAQASRAIGQSAPVTEWWRLFGDPVLNRLVDEAFRTNYRLQIATARIRQARAQRGITAADLFPQIDADGGYEHARGSRNVVLPLSGASGSGGSSSGSSGSGNSAGGRSGATKAAATDPSGSSGGMGGAGGSSGSSSGGATSASFAPAASNPLTPFGKGGLPGATTDLYQIGFDANWEVDVFGGTRRRLEAATADLEASVEDRRDIMVSLLAEVARDYMELRGTQQRLAVAQENLLAQRQILELTRSMAQSGLNTELDVTRAAAEEATTLATVAPLEAQVRQLIHALSILVSREPNALSEELSQAQPLPPVPPQVPVGLPSELLRRRPDIRRAERQIASANARVGSAKADLYPRFTITGSVGLDASSLNHLLEWQSRYFLVNPGVNWPVFDAGRIRSNIALQKANFQESVFQYRNAILSAMQEVEDALAFYATEQARQTALSEAVKQSRLAFELARSRYEHGLADFLTVLDAQRSVLSAEDTLAQSNQSVATDLVSLYKALGGGWEMESGKNQNGFR